MWVVACFRCYDPIVGAFRFDPHTAPLSIDGLGWVVAESVLTVQTIGDEIADLAEPALVSNYKRHHTCQLHLTSAIIPAKSIS